jgi:hypothetical protein
MIVDNLLVRIASGRSGKAVQTNYDLARTRPKERRIKELQPAGA